MSITISQMLHMCWQKYMVMKNGRYQINVDVLLFPWKLTYKNPRSGLVPKGSFGKVHLAQDAASRKRMACKLVSPATQMLESRQWQRHSQFLPMGKGCLHTPAWFCLFTQQLHLWSISVKEHYANPTFAVLLFSDVKLETRCSFKKRNVIE